MSRFDVDYSLYLVTDSTLCGSRGVPETARLAVAGGATVVQVREKSASTPEFIALAKAVKTAIAGTRARLIINDNLDVALAVEADGVHIGQSDTPYPEARRIMGPEAIIGLSVETMDQIAQASAWDVDYLGVSPVFETPTKTDTAPAWGLDGLRRLRSATPVALVGIGGIGPLNAADVIRAGADGVAVVSAICATPDPEAAARSLFAQVRSARI
ncbi:MAG: thiamine phosphate synthase [Proteobacteria bacterium]|nr:thiamine phosphate synthase [Pseudomonadota bacterium]